MADIDVLALTPARPASSDFAVAVRAGGVQAVYQDGDDMLDSWFGVTGSGDDTTALNTFLTYCVENGKRAVLTKAAYTVSGPILDSTSRTGTRKLVVHARVPCTFTVNPSSTIDYFIYLSTTAEHFIDWSGALVTFDGSNKCGNFMRADNNGADNTGEAVFNPAPFIKNLNRTTAGEANGIALYGPYRRIYAVQPQVDTISRGTTGECGGFVASGFTGEAVVVEPIISRITCPAGFADADGVKLFGKMLNGDFNKRAGKATIYGGVFTDCQGRNVKFQCSESAIYHPLSIRQNVVSIAQSVDYDFQHGNGLLDAPRYIYKKNGTTSPLGASHAPVAFQQTLGDQDMVSVCRDAEMVTEVDMPYFCLVTHFSTSRASITRVTGLRIHQSGFTTRVFTRALMEADMGIIAAKSYPTTLEVSNCQGPIGLYAIGYTGYTGTPSLNTKLSIVVRDNNNTLLSSVYLPWYALSGAPVRDPMYLLLRNNSGWQSVYGDLDLNLTRMGLGCIVTTDMSSCVVTGKPSTWTSGYATWEAKDSWFGSTEKTIQAYLFSGGVAPKLALTYNSGTTWHNATIS